MAPPKVTAMRNIMMQLRKVCQHPYFAHDDLEDLSLPEQEQHRQLVEASGKLVFLKLLLPKLIAKEHRILLFSQFKIALDRIEDFLYFEGIKFLRLDGDVQQAQRQKSMDAFNAPNSEYSVFLLTTRAGGVGINLATADCVIIFDPDFNPHQDLQAIARAHRYGQKKRVLVFKLMMKHSVEERIIQKTKKKLVLDNVVVQNLEATAEDGELGNILLHGAKELYETDAEGRSKNDIVYTSKSVDELISKVEQEAEDAAKEMERLEQLEKDAAANGGAGAGSDADAAKEKRATQAFGFAKVWEAENDALAEARGEEPLTEEQELEDQTAAWAAMLEGARRAEEAQREDEMQRRAARKRKGITMQVADPSASQLSDHDGPALQDTRPGKKKKKGKKGGKAGGADASSDAEFAAPAEGDSESDGGPSDEEGEAEALVDETGRVIVLPGRSNSVVTAEELAQWEATKAAAKAAKAGRVTVPTSHTMRPVGASAQAGAGPSRMPDGVGQLPQAPPPPPETAEEKKARRAKRKAEKAAAAAAALKAAALKAAAVAAVIGTTPSTATSALSAWTASVPPPSAGPSQPPSAHQLPQVLSSAAAPALPPNQPRPAQPVAPAAVPAGAPGGRAPPALSAADHQRIEQGRIVLQWLWQVFAEMRMPNESARWGALVLPERALADRQSDYNALAHMADNILVHQGLVPVFETKAVRDLATSFLASRFEIFTSDSLNKPLPVPPTLPSLGQVASGPVNGVQMPTTGSRHPMPPAQQQQQPQRPSSPAPALQVVERAQSNGVPSAGPSQLQRIPQAPHTASQAQSNGVVAERSPQPPQAPQPAHRSLSNGPTSVPPTQPAQSAVTSTHPAQSSALALAPAPGAELHCIGCGSGDHRLPACPTAPPLATLLKYKHHLLREDQTRTRIAASLVDIEQCIERCSKPQSPVVKMEDDRRAGNASQRAKSAAAPKTAVNDGQGTRHAPVVVDDDDVEDEAGTAGVQTASGSAQPTVAQNANGGPSSSAADAQQRQTASAVETNVTSAASATASSAPRWKAASKSPEACAFCGTQCGSSSLRACAEARGGRKALKAYIRQLDGDRDSWQDDVKNEMHARMGKLYDLYQAWPR